MYELALYAVYLRFVFKLVCKLTRETFTKF